MATTHPLKVSYCTTCMGRLHHLKETLPKNLEAEKDNPNVEFVVLSYGKDPEMDAYMKENYLDEINSGRIRYVTYPDATHFQMAHAKNMAHRMASGDILCSLDADNTLTPGTAGHLQALYAKGLHQMVTHIPASPELLIKQKLDRFLFKGKLLKQHKASMTGRIAVSRTDYEMLNGYDEHFSGWGGDDINFAKRAWQAGISMRHYPAHLHGDVIDHMDEDRLSNLSEEDQERSRNILENIRTVNANPPSSSLATKAKNIYKAYQKFSTPIELANLDGNVGCGTVYVNFSKEPTEIAPLNSKVDKAAQYEMEQDAYAASLKKDWAQQHLAENKDVVHHR